MTQNIRLADELGQALRESRRALGMTKTRVAEHAGKVREVVYRLEAGEESSVSSLLAVASAMRWRDASKRRSRTSGSRENC